MTNPITDDELFDAYPKDLIIQYIFKPAWGGTPNIFLSSLLSLLWVLLHYGSGLRRDTWLLCLDMVVLACYLVTRPWVEYKRFLLRRVREREEEGSKKAVQEK